MIKRVTITIKPALLKEIDNLIDKKTIRNRSHAIEHILNKTLHGTGITTALIMAGGSGVKIRSIPYEIHKALIPIHGKPILEHQLTMLRQNNVHNIIISLGKNYEKITEYFGNGEKFGVNINYVLEDKPLGSAGAIGPASRYIDDSFLLINVDTLMKPSVHDFYTFHKKEQTIGTVLLSTAGKTKPWGVVEMLGNQVINFLEKPKEGKSYSKLVNAGLCIFEKNVVKYIPNKRLMISELFKKLIAKKQLSGFLHDGVIFDVGTPEGYEHAIKKWKDI